MADFWNPTGTASLMSPTPGPSQAAIKRFARAGRGRSRRESKRHFTLALEEPAVRRRQKLALLRGSHMRKPARDRSRLRAFVRSPRAITGVAAVLVASGILLAAPTALAAGAPPAPATVAARLGANHIPAEVVILVDTSKSMEWDGLYPVVKRELPRFMDELKKQDPHDTVGVVVFGTRHDTRVIYLGPPTTAVSLPPRASSNATDFGYAFQKALDILSRASSKVKVGGVLLLSDGTLNAVGDPHYNGYSAPGWARLRSRAHRLGMTLTGYGFPLRGDRAGIDSVNRALDAVFTHRVTLGPNLGDLGRELSLADQKIMNDRVASAVQPDSGKGIRVAWRELPGSAQTPALDLGTGHAELRLQLTAMTQRVPLDVAGLTVTASGFPVTVTGSVAGGGRSLAPGQSVTVPVRLTWQPVSRRSLSLGGGRAVHGRLTLTGRVTSPYTSAIKDGFDDRSFAVGGLTGEESAPLVGTIPGPVNDTPWLAALVVLLVAAAGAAGLSTQMGGRLILVHPEHAPVAIALHRLPWISRSTQKLIGIPGRVTVLGAIRRKRIRVHLRLGQQTDTVVMKPWDQAVIAGVHVIHELKRGSLGTGETDPASEAESQTSHGHGKSVTGTDAQSLSAGAGAGRWHRADDRARDGVGGSEQD